MVAFGGERPYQSVSTYSLPIGRESRAEAKIATTTATTETRSALLRAAKRLFAERGFYGASIAQIAEELGLTKQALLHHFGSKERLYAEVLAQIADGLSHVVGDARAAAPDPVRQLEALLTALHGAMSDHPENTLLLMRELLDNRSRAEHAHSWYLKDFLDAVTALVQAASPDGALTPEDALARSYLVLGAINYVAVSEPTLRQMYPDREAVRTRVPQEIRRLVRLYLS